MNAERLQRLMTVTRQHGLAGLALVPGHSMDYVSEIHSHTSERPIVLFLPVDGEPAIIIPALEAMKASADGIPPERIFAYTDEEWYPAAFARAARALNLNAQWGVEALQMRVVELDMLTEMAPGFRSVHAEEIIIAVRGVKDEAEIAKMQVAVDIAEKGIEMLLPTIKIGETEKEIANRLRGILLDLGGDGMAFGPIVSAGPNSASPHAVPTDRPLAAGDLLIIDWGVTKDGYVSDITRTYAVGEISDTARTIYELVKGSNAAGRRASQPGASGQDVDRASRAVIVNGGYGDYFIHRTGHGLGKEAHEPPSIVEGNTTPMVPGNVFTVEPGIYVPELGGVRIEDDVVITKDGHISLTSLSRELIQVG
ncbi:MAG: aminopeptidase P family protein [Anaerolineales bacterium]|nr:aminopeptidase P family protein [Anaerolineales bacterium]MCB0007510.1 aminopeptidase P family protein [Anaerolineales bacterium]MCB0027643.1 aminopeptidase P family protein [Anaerolineales bacterium]